MKLNFLGGSSGVTGSKTVLEIEKESYLIDYGLFQGGSKVREMNWTERDLSKITAVILTHAHVDHSGLIPRLKRSNFKGKIYCTPDTFELCQILLADSAKIHEEDAKYANKRKYSRHKPALPLYTSEDVKEVLQHFQVVDFNSDLALSEHLTIRFHWAGHILGASFVECTIKENELVKKIVFSGDVGHERSAILKGPENLVPCDFLVLESTYGNKLHARTPAMEVLELYLNIILKRQGTAIIPAFSVGRTQEILFLINQLMKENKIPKVPVILDSPLSKKANRIFVNSLKKEFVQDQVFKFSTSHVFPESLREVETVEESKALHATSGPMIIVSASGMMDGGRVIHHVKNRITNPNNGIIFVGFQPEGTKGRILLDGAKTLRLHKEEFDVNADVFYIDALSAHADYLDLVDWLKKSEVSPKLIILNHGEPESSHNMKLIIESQLGIKTTISEMNEEFNLDYL